jgi:hypothetical protein
MFNADINTLKLFVRCLKMCQGESTLTASAAQTASYATINRHKLHSTGNPSMSGKDMEGLRWLRGASYS